MIFFLIIIIIMICFNNTTALSLPLSFSYPFFLSPTSIRCTTRRLGMGIEVSIFVYTEVMFARAGDWLKRWPVRGKRKTGQWRGLPEWNDRGR
jgi:hypothetical protein